jgi:hypothetical protein
VGYGWSGGKFYDINKMFVFRAREAHAWVEVKLDGYGWVLMEPTPPQVLSDRQPRLAEAGEKMPTPEEMIEEERAAFEQADANLAGWAIALTAGFGLGAVFLLFIKKQTPEDSRGGSHSSSARHKESGYFATWRKAFGKRYGSIGAGSTLRNQVESLDHTPEFSDELIRYHYSVRYEGRSIDPKRERGIEREIEKWADS